MTLDSRALALTQPPMNGDDVDRLHKALSQLGDGWRQLVEGDVDGKGRRQFGGATELAVRRFQEANRQRLGAVIATSLDGHEQVRWSGEWGVVDPVTAQILGEDVARASEPFIVRGRAEYEDGTPAEGLLVAIYDRDLGTERQLLGKRDGHLTNAGGVFPDVHYHPRTYARAESPRGAGADLVVGVTSADPNHAVELVAVHRQLAIVRKAPAKAAEEQVPDLVLGFPASPLETLRLVVRRDGHAVPSEYERLMSALQPLLSRGTTPDQFDEATHRDISFAARETQEDRAQVETLSQAWMLSKAAELPPELCYGLLRHGPPTTVQPMPHELAPLLSHGRVAWEAKLTEAFELRLIPDAMRHDLAAWLDRLQELRARDLLHQTTDREMRVSLADVLRLVGIPADQQKAFAKLLAGCEGLAEEFWKKTTEQLQWSDAHVQSVQSALHLADVVSSHKPLMNRLFEIEEAPSTRRLAGWERGRLDEVVAQTGSPADVAGETEEDRRREFVDDIENQLRVLHPAEYVAKTLRRVEDVEIRKAGDWLHQTLMQTGPTIEGVPAFDLMTMPATGYLRDYGDRIFARTGAEERALRSSQLKRVQRVFQVSATPEQMPQLFAEKLESAHYIMRWSHEHFVKQYGDRLGGEDAAAVVHSRAGHIHSTLFNLYLDFRKVLPTGGWEPEKPMVSNPLPAVRPPTVEELFGSDDLCTCAACLSVLSPAAYFVDLLQFLDVPSSPTSNLRALLARRPDLEHIQLTCENTNTRIPYVDLVNEILASYVAHEKPFAYNDPKDGVAGGTAEELRVNPISLTDAAAQAETKAYERLEEAVFPFSLPYHHWLEVVRRYLSHFRITRDSLMRRFQPDEELDTELAIAAEAIQLSPQEFEMVTRAQFDGAPTALAPTLESQYGFVVTAAPGTANHVSPEFTKTDQRTEALKALQNFLKNISNSPGLTPAIRSKIKVNGVLTTETEDAINAYRADHALPTPGTTDAAFWGALAAEGYRALSLLVSHVPMFLRQTGVSYDELVELVTTKFLNPVYNDRVFFSAMGITAEEIMAFVQSGLPTIPAAMQAKIPAGITTVTFLQKVDDFKPVLVLDSPPSALCDVDQTTIRHIDGSLLTDAELQAIVQFVRLWRKMGWSLHETDLVLSLFPFSAPFDLIFRAADIKTLLDDLRIPLEQLTALWGPIDTWTEHSLYERLFRSKTSQSLDPLFELDDVRREIKAFVVSPGTPPLLKDHLPLLLAAFRVSAAELDELRALLADDELKIANVSALYRHVVLMKALSLTASDLLVLQALSGVDPFVVPAAQLSSAATLFVRAARDVQSFGFTIAQLDYLIRHRPDASDRQLLTPEQRRDVIGSIRAGLEEIQREYVPADDPEGARLARQLAAALHRDDAQTLSAMTYGSVVYSAFVKDVPSTVAFPASVASKVKYDADRQMLTFAGVMTVVEQGALTGVAATLPIAVKGPFIDAVDALFLRPETFAKEKLFDLMDAGELITLLRSASSLTVKVATILEHLRYFLSKSLIKRTISEALHFEGPTVEALLEDADVLTALNVSGAPAAIEDFLALSGSGLRATYFNNAIVNPPSVVDVLDPGIDYSGTTPLPAPVNPTLFSVRWTGYVYAPVTEDFTFVVRVRDAVRVWLNGALVLDEWKPQPVTEFQVPTKLRKGSINEITVEHAHTAGPVVVELRWRSPSTELLLVPANAFYTEDVLQSHLIPLERLEKIAALVSGLQLSGADIGGVSRLGYFDWNDTPVAPPPTAAAVTALFEQWNALRQFAAVRDRISKTPGAFVGLLESASLDAALDEFEQLTGSTKADTKRFAEASTRHPFNGVTLTYADVPPGVGDLSWWARLRDSCAAIARSGCSAEQIVEWATVKDVARVAPVPPVVNWYAMSLDVQARSQARKMAQDLKRLVNAHYDEADWRIVARPINDQLRMRDRDALTAYVMQMPAILEEHYLTADELFEYFLIDVKMDPCMETSRIQQGTATCLLFLQRILMGLYKSISPASVDRGTYERMQSYALWHPSREILIHPESYIRWDLIDRKSEPYRGLERDLRKQDLTQIHALERSPGGWAETAFMNYLEKFDEIAKVEICGIHEDGDANVLHVFGRTQSAPFRFYYRRADNFRGVGFDTGQWTAWERLPLDIDTIQESLDVPGGEVRGGVHLMPVVWNRRLYLFWPQFRLVPEAAANEKMPEGFDKVNRWDIRLAWSELWNGAWSPKQVTVSTVASPPLVGRYTIAETFSDDTQANNGTWTQHVHMTNFTWFGNPFPPGGQYLHGLSNAGLVRNPLVGHPGVSIRGLTDYARYRQYIVDKLVVSYLPRPEEHYFHVSEVDGELKIFPAVRYLTPRVSGKEQRTITQALILKQEEKVTSLQKTLDPVDTPVSYTRRYHGQLGVFSPGKCKVRDVETFSRETPDNFWSFHTPIAADNSFQNCHCAHLFVPYFALWDERKILAETRPGYRVHGHTTPSGFSHTRAFFFQDRGRVYLVTPTRKQRNKLPTKKGVPAAAKVDKSGFLENLTGSKYTPTPEFVFQLHSQPHVCEFIRRLNHKGLFALLAKDTQQLGDPAPGYFKAQYLPTGYVAKPYPEEIVETGPNGAYSQYHWELFVYAPMRAWQELLKSHQFSEAQMFLQAVANFTSPDGHVWQFIGFQKPDMLRIQETLAALAYTGSDAKLLADKLAVQTEVAEWIRDPFNPHLIGRRRVSAYMLAITMDCCRHHLAAADFEFTRYTMESLPKAIQHLVIVVKLLGGRRPGPVRSPGKVKTETFHTLTAKKHLSPFGQLSIALGELETALPFTHSMPTTPGTTGSASSIQTMYFCIPPNEEWGRLWDRVADRLYKIRHCMNIDGIVQELPLFPEPIDPMLLVQARAQGLDISSVFDDFRSPLPHHEFSVVFEKALRMVDDVRAFAARFETLTEKGEAEGLAELRIEQEAEWLKDYLRRELVQAIALQAATRQAVEKTRAATQARFDFYDEQIKRGLIDDEKAQRSELGKAHVWETMAQGAEIQANVAGMIPDAHAQGLATGTSFGGTHLGPALRAVGGMFRSLGAEHTYRSRISEINAGWERRLQEWTFQRSIADTDLKKVDVELLAARIQENVANLRLENHDKTTANTQAVLNYYRQQRFFTSEQYGAVAEDLYPDFFELFQLAYQYARQAEACCRFQFALPRMNIIQFGYWNNARKGLLAGERLHLALKQLERAYLDLDKREYELTQDVSLAMLDPQAFIGLKVTGHCEFEIPETFFDASHPGHYMRRLRSVSVTIPCVVGRATNVNCTLTLLKSKVRITTEVPLSGYAEDLLKPDKRFLETFAATQSIVTSHAQNDSGLFEMESKDGRNVPFRWAGAITRWRIDVPRETNAWDMNSMSDLMLRLQMSAQPGGEPLRKAAETAREAALKSTVPPQRRLFLGRAESRDRWHKFLHPDVAATSQILSIDITTDSISALFRDRTIAVADVDVYINFKHQRNNAVYAAGPAVLSARLSHQAGAIVTPVVVQNLKSAVNLKDMPAGSFPISFDITPGVVSTLRLEILETSVAGIAPALTESIPGTTRVRLKADAIDDVWIVVQYALK